MTAVTTALTIRAHGHPVAQGSHVAIMIGKGPARRPQVVAVNAAALTKWRNTVKTATVDAMTAAGWLTLTGPAAVDALFLLERPRTVRRESPTVAPDLDKLVRALGDALTDAGAVGDDALVVEWRVRKAYAGPGQAPGVRALVRPVEELIL